MTETCLVCKAIYLEMISILRHPGKLDYMLNCLLGLQAHQDDYLCNKCCNDVMNAFDSKQKFHQLSPFEPKVLRRDGVAVKDDVGQFEETDLSAVFEMKIEPKSEDLEEDVEDANDGTRAINQCDKLMKPGLQLKVKEERDAFEIYRPASQGSVDGMADGKREKYSTRLYETKSSEKDFNMTTLDSGCRQTNSKEHFKREKSIDIEDSANDEIDLGTISFRFTKSRSVRNCTGAHNSNTNDRPANKKPYVCRECGKSFTKLHTLKLHGSTHTGEKPYKCFECGKTFITAVNLKIHKRTHTGETPYKCSGCEQSFITWHQRKIHESVHTGEKPYKCHECKKGYITWRQLKIHESIHSGKDPYKCHECKKSFISPYELKQHERTHTGEKPYKCFECGKAFIRPYQLKIHERTHTGEKPYKCHECNKDFITTSDLKQHEKIHTGEKPYKCFECDKAFITAYKLKIHENIHTGEKPYKCHECKRAFIKSSDLKRHERIHTGERPYKCFECGKAFLRAYQLKIHESIHTGERS